MKEMEIEKTTTSPAPTEEPNALIDHLRLRYPIEIVEDDDGVVASLPDLPGCVSFGETIQEAVDSLNSTKELWIRGRLESGQPVPDPSNVEDFSGKFVLRVPRGLHKSLDREAKRQGVSLNTYILHLLSERHAVTKLESYVKQVAPALVLSGGTIHADFDWPEGRVQTVRIVHASAASTTGSAALSMIDFVRKPPKRFRRVLKQARQAAPCKG